MRMKTGDKVEVMNEKEAPVSWRVGKVLSGNDNDRTYCIQYDCCADEKMETVARKSVRPSPPRFRGVENFIAGDFVEVFYENAWKIAVILKVLEGKKGMKSKRVPQDSRVQKQYLVRPIGCSYSRGLIVLGSNIRMRQTWREGKWVLIGKVSRAGGDEASNFPIPESNTKTKNQPKKDGVNIQDEALFQEPRIISPRSLKRKPPSIIEANKRSLKRKSSYIPNTVEANNGIEKYESENRVLQKVDAVAYPRELLGKKNTHASFKTEKTKLNCCRVRISENDACSVGSCSITGRPQNNFYNPPEDTLDSDAESCNFTTSERKSSPEEVEDSIHRLELNAYRRTLEALYASGPLSWDQEALLTNLRIMLNISNDEHLMELKHLICAKRRLDIRS